MYKKVEVDGSFLEYLEEVSFDLLREVKFYLGQGFKEVYLYDSVGLNVLILANRKTFSAMIFNYSNQTETINMSRVDSFDVGLLYSIFYGGAGSDV